MRSRVARAKSFAPRAICASASPVNAESCCGRVSARPRSELAFANAASASEYRDARARISPRNSQASAAPGCAFRKLVR